jgi:hypothetical protein
MTVADDLWRDLQGSEAAARRSCKDRVSSITLDCGLRLDAKTSKGKSSAAKIKAPKKKVIIELCLALTVLQRLLSKTPYTI